VYWTLSLLKGAGKHSRTRKIRWDSGLRLSEKNVSDEAVRTDVSEYEVPEFEQKEAEGEEV